MAVKCSSYGCTNRRRKGSDIHFHRFPLNRPDLLKKWIEAMKWENFKPSKYSYLCSDHFTIDSYQRRPGSLKFLLNSAVPSIFNSIPECLQNKEFVDRQSFNKQQLVTCGKCKKQMPFEEYDTTHRNVHYNLCWIDGTEDKIDFTDTPKILTILRKTYNKTKKRFKCEQCYEIKTTMIGFAQHLRICRINNSEYSDDSKSIQCNLETTCKNEMSTQIRILQQCIKRKNVRINVLKSIIESSNMNVPLSNEVTRNLEKQFDFNKPSTSSGKSNIEMPDMVQEPWLHYVATINNVEQSDCPIDPLLHRHTTEHKIELPENDDSQIIFIDDYETDQEPIVVSDDDEPQLVSVNENKLKSITNNEIAMIINVIRNSGELIVIPNRKSFFLTPEVIPYKIQEMTLQGKLIYCINVKPYSTVELMVTLENLVLTVLFPYSVENCANVLRNQLKINLYCGNLEQMKLLIAQKLIRNLSASGVSIIMLNDLIPVLIKLKQLLKRLIVNRLTGTLT